MRRGRRGVPIWILAFQALVVGIAPGPLLAQVRWQDLVLTGGVSGEGYRGNLPAVTVSAVDSTEAASAAVGEFGVRGGVVFHNSRRNTLDLAFDAGLRQFAAGGFVVRDYAPREWVGQADLRYRQTLESLGELWVESRLSGSRVKDRPPMPLFIQPGHTAVDGRVRLQFLPRHGAYVDAQLMAELADYPSDEFSPLIGLLDRKMVGLEAGVTWAPGWTIRLHSGFSLSRFDNQKTFDPGDPHRRDRTLTVGATWTTSSDYFVQLGVEGAVNRSNSSRPEYNAISLRAVASAPLPHELSLTFFADLTDKRYLTQTEFARLVPGEEADNASVVYLELARPLKVNLDGAIRFGWTRAETDIGDSYFERYGTTLLLRYRPWER